MSVYLRLTEEFNRGKLRTVIASGQAVVLHRLAITSKDGDWILREDEESLNHVLKILQSHGAHYRFGAPLDLRWLRHGWSSHFEFSQGGLRVRTDFFTRPPRLSHETIQKLWTSQEGQTHPYIGLVELAEMKKTNREKDFAIIGELARKMPDVSMQLFYSRSARDLLELMKTHPLEWQEAVKKRPLLASATHGREALETALDAERRKLMRLNEARLESYELAAKKWASRWPSFANSIPDLPLLEIHDLLVSEAERLLPFNPHEITSP